MHENKGLVAVLMGGQSTEHEVSLRSGAGVVAALGRRGYKAVPVVIAMSGEWLFPGETPRSFHDAVARLDALRPDCVFIALHGGAGEDGRMQGLLDLMGLPYTGSGCAASALAMDKVRAKALVESAGVRVAKQIVLDAADWAGNRSGCLERIRRDIGLPCVIKAPCQGSSCGMAITFDGARLEEDLDTVMAVEGRLMVEEYIRGREVTCAVLDAEPAGARALPLTEICPKTAAFFDYTAKYTPGASEEITPARVPEETAAAIGAMSLAVHRAIGCAGWSRSDFLIDENGPLWLEVNTVPGLTETSLFPQAAAAVGIVYDELMELFVAAVLRAKAAQR